MNRPMRYGNVLGVGLALTTAAFAAINISEFPVRIGGIDPDAEKVEVFVGDEAAFTVGVEANEGYVLPAAMAWRLDGKVVWSERSVTVPGSTNLVWTFRADEAGLGTHDLAFELEGPIETSVRSWRITVPEPVPYDLAFERNNAGATGPDLPATNLLHHYNNRYVVPTPPWTLAGSAFLGWAVSPDGDIAYAPGETVSDIKFGPESSDVLFAVWRVGVTSEALPPAVGGTPYAFTLEAVGGNDRRNWTWDFDSAEDVGFHLDPESGLVSDIAGDGSVMTAGSYPLTVFVTSGGGLSAAQKMTLDVVTTYRVAFHAGSSLAKGSMEPLACRWDVSARLPSPTFEMKQGAFLGWATEPFGDVVYADGEEIVNLTPRQGETIDLYARWDVGGWRLLFDPAGGTPVAPVNIPVGESGLMPSAVPVREGWTFAGWKSPDDPVTYAAGAVYGNSRLVADGGLATVGEGENVRFTAQWRPVACTGLETTDLLGNVWTYDRYGDEVTVKHVELAPGLTTTGVPAMLNEGRVVNAAIFIVPIRATVGTFGSWRLEEMGIEWPKGRTVADVKLETLPKGLKLVKSPIKSGSTVIETVYSIEGVPTETLDLETQPVFARISLLDGKTKTECVQRLAFEVAEPMPAALPAAVFGEDYAPFQMDGLWPDADATWTYKGWPAGMKYTAKAIPAKGAVAAVPALSLYGRPTKPGAYEIVASYKAKIGSFTVTESRKATLVVWPTEGDPTYHRIDRAYVPLADASAGPGVTAASGLPTGVKFAAGAFVGTPTKPGVYAVTLTRSDKTKETFLWKVEAGENAGAVAGLDFLDAPVDNAVVSLVQGSLGSWSMTAPQGAKVSVSGLPSGLKLVQDKATGEYALSGVPAKPGVFVLTFKTVANGVTRVERRAMTVFANPVAGTYDGAVLPNDIADGGEATLVVAANGTAKLTFGHGSVKTTVQASGFTIWEWSGPDAPDEGSWNYRFDLPSVPKAGLPARTLLVALKTSPSSAGVVTDVQTLYLLAGGTTEAVEFAAMPLSRRLGAAVAAPVTTCVLSVPGEAGEPGEAAWAAFLWDAKKGQFAVSGKLPAGKAFSKAAFPIGTGAPADDVSVQPFAAVDADKATYLVELTPDGRGALTGLVRPAVGPVLTGGYAGFFGGTAAPLPTTVGAALGLASDADPAVVPGYAVWPDETEPLPFDLKVQGLSVNADFGSGFAPKDVKASVDKKTGLVKMTFKDGAATYAVEALPVSDNRLAGQVLRTVGKEKKLGFILVGTL